MNYWHPIPIYSLPNQYSTGLAFSHTSFLATSNCKGQTNVYFENSDELELLQSETYSEPIVALAHGNDFVVSATQSGTVHLNPYFSTVEHSSIRALDLNQVCSVDVSARNTHLSLSGKCNTVQIWDIETRSLQQSLAHSHWNSVNRAQFSKISPNLVTTCGHSEIVVNDLRTNQAVIHLPTQSHNEVLDVKCHPNYDYIIGSGHSDGCAVVWDLRDVPKYVNQCAPNVGGHNAPVNSIDFHPKQNFLITSSAAACWVYNLDFESDNRPLSVVEISEPANCVAFSPDGQNIAISCLFGRVEYLKVDLVRKEQHGENKPNIINALYERHQRQQEKRRKLARKKHHRRNRFKINKPKNH